MPVYPNIRFYAFDPRDFFPDDNGDITDPYSGPPTPSGTATITDNGSNQDSSLTLEDRGEGEEATADVNIGGDSSIGSRIEAERSWTVEDTQTGEQFEVVQFRVRDGDASGQDYTISEVPLVPGRTYEVINYENNPNDADGSPVLSYEDYYAGWADTDGDGDGVRDRLDLDDDNDGILDADEKVISQSFVGTTNDSTNVNTFTVDSQDNGLTFDFYELDNSFNLSINGDAITSEEVQFQGGVAASGNVQNIQFTDGTNYEAGGIAPVWALTGTEGNPIIRVIINENGDVQILGSKLSATDPSYALEEMELINSVTFEPFT